MEDFRILSVVTGAEAEVCVGLCCDCPQKNTTEVHRDNGSGNDCFGVLVCV